MFLLRVYCVFPIHIFINFPFRFWKWHFQARLMSRLFKKKGKITFMIFYKIPRKYSRYFSENLIYKIMTIDFIMFIVPKSNNYNKLTIIICHPCWSKQIVGKSQRFPYFQNSSTATTLNFTRGFIRGSLEFYKGRM